MDTIGQLQALSTAVLELKKSRHAARQVTTTQLNSHQIFPATRVRSGYQPGPAGFPSISDGGGKQPRKGYACEPEIDTQNPVLNEHQVANQLY